LDAAAQPVNHPRPAVRFCVVINNGHAGAGGFQSLENAGEPYWKSPRGPRESRVLHQNPGPFPFFGSAALSRRRSSAFHYFLTQHFYSVAPLFQFRIALSMKEIKIVGFMDFSPTQSVTEYLRYA